MERLFEDAYSRGVVANREFYDTYKPVKDYLRTVSLTLSQQDRADIADFKDFRKRNLGLLRLRDEGGTPVDSAYIELREMAPELFPESITHPADQLVRMADVVRDIRVTEESLDDYYGPDAAMYKQMARKDFGDLIYDSLAQLRNLARYLQDEQTAEAARQAESETALTLDAVKELYPVMKNARRAYERTMSKQLLTTEDKNKVNQLLRGELTLEGLDPESDNYGAIRAVYEAKLEYEKYASQIRQWNRSRRAKLTQQASAFTEGALAWKDKRGAAYARETMERNIRDIVPDREQAEQMIDTYFKPVHRAAAQANKLKNEYRERVRKLNLSRDAEPGHVSEAYAVQFYGEAMDNIRVIEQSHGRIEHRNGMTMNEWLEAIQEMWEKNPQLEKEKIETAVQEFHKIYDELFEQMNASRIRNGYEPISYRRGYFPHFQAQDEEGIFAQFGKALGIQTEVTSLPTSINGLTHKFRPGIRWMGNALERTSFGTVYDSVEGFDRYIEGAADVIYQTDNIQRLRALASRLRYDSTDDGVRERVDQVRANESLSEADKELRIREIYDNARFSMSNFVVELDEYTNLLANKRSQADRNMERMLGRSMYNVVKTLEGRVAANMVAINPGSWITNFVPLVQGAASLEKGHIWKGMWDTLRAIKNDDGFVDASDFLTNRRGSDPLVRTWQQKTSALLSTPMEWIDCFTADSLVRARYQQNLEKGLSQVAAMEEADQWTAGVMADRSKGAMPTLFAQNNPLTKLFTQFQLEVNNQLSYVFKDLPREAGDKDKYALALAAMLFKFSIFSYLFNDVYEWLYSRRPALDPIGILNDTSADLFGFALPNAVDFITGADRSLEARQTKTSEALSNLGANVLEEMPFVGGLMGGGRLPISSALPDVGKLVNAATNESWSGKKRLTTAATELGRPLTYMALPFGGGQLKKIFEGLKAVRERGSYSVNAAGEEELQYPIHYSNGLEMLLAYSKAITFGKSLVQVCTGMGGQRIQRPQRQTDRGLPGHGGKWRRQRSGLRSD